nr:hypothetical protein CFP56_45759 [Quercus suber]
MDRHAVPSRMGVYRRWLPEPLRMGWGCGYQRRLELPSNRRSSNRCPSNRRSSNQLPSNRRQYWRRLELKWRRYRRQLELKRRRLELKR